MTYNCARCGNPWAAHGTACEERHVKPPGETRRRASLSEWLRSGHTSSASLVRVLRAEMEQTRRNLTTLHFDKARRKRVELLAVAADILEERLGG